MPDFPIVDTHVHFWDETRVPLSWNKALPPIDRPFLPADFDADRNGVEVGTIVFVEADVEPGRHVDEARFIAALAEADPRIRGIVAHAPLQNGGAVAADLDRLAAVPLVKGVRRLIQGQDAAALCASEAFRDGVRLLPHYAFHFEICILHDQLAEVLKLVEACPGVHFVLDHIAKPGIEAGLTEPWWSEIATLAGFDNVDCKVSGVATEADHAAWSEHQLAPYLARVLEVFGPERVLFGSDWPVMRLAIAYPRWVEIVERAVADWSEADRRRLFSDNARRVYRL